MEAQLTVIVSSMVSAVVYSTIFYAKKFTSKEKEKVNVKKFAATLVVGAAVGVAYGYYGVPVNEANVFEKLAAYAGTIALVESLIKTGMRFMRKKLNK